MTIRRSLLPIACLLVALAAPATASAITWASVAERLGLASQTAENADDAASAEMSWEDRLQAASDRVARARLRAAKAEAAYSRARHDGYPRGPALQAIKEEWEAAAVELEDSREALPELVDEAQRAGVEPAVLRPYRD